MEITSYITDVEKSFSNFTMVNNSIVKHFGDFNAAGILGYIISEAKHMRSLSKLDSQGYFWCKADKLEDKFGLSRKVQDKLIKRLKEANFIEAQTKKVEGSTNDAKIRHFKVNYTAIYNFVKDIKEAAKPVEVETLPEDLAEIKNTLKAFVISKGARFNTTKEDEAILKIARMSGFTEQISIPAIAERIKKYTNASFTCKYLIKTLVSNFDDIYNNLNQQTTTNHINLIIN